MMAARFRQQIGTRLYRAFRSFDSRTLIDDFLMQLGQRSQMNCGSGEAIWQR